MRAGSWPVRECRRRDGLRALEIAEHQHRVGQLLAEPLLVGADGERRGDIVGRRVGVVEHEVDLCEREVRERDLNG